MTIAAEALDLPFEAAISFFRQKFNVPTKHWRQVYVAAHAHSFMVAGASSRALLGDFRSAVDKAIAEGTTLAEFRSDFDAIVERHGWSHTGGRNWRSRVIFETNIRSAYAAGRYHQMTLPGTLEAFPFWQYNHSGSNHPRQNHLSWDGLVLRANDPFWSTNYPPNGWGCGCFPTVVSNSGLARQGKTGPDHSPDLRQLGTDVPLGVDPGFEWNPGQRWLSGGRPGQKPATRQELKHFASRALAGDLPSPTTLPIADVPDALAASLGLPKKSSVRLSVETIRNHVGRHGIVSGDYQIHAGNALLNLVRDNKGRISALLEINGKPFVAGFKATRFGEFLMTTLRPANPRQIRKLKSLPAVN